jgi:uncharacterized protein (TIGR02118 family)
MANSVQVLYPNAEGTHFDHDYYTATHMKMVADAWGALTESVVVTRGVAGGPNVPPGYHAIATLVFKSAEAMKEGMGKAQHLLDDIPNFTNTTPQMLIGEVIA